MIRYIPVLKYVLFGLILFLIGCKSLKVSRTLEQNIETIFGDRHFTGLVVYNPESKDTIISYNSNQYFTPASNVKIFTLYSALKVLPENIPAFNYSIEKDTITIQGVGNPTFLHSYFNDSTALSFTSKFNKINLVANNLIDDKYGPGWAWEDFDAPYSLERSSFPMYGNVLSISNNKGLKSVPNTLLSDVEVGSNSMKRELAANTFYFDPKVKDSVKIPMFIDSLLTVRLWNELVPNKVRITDKMSRNLSQTAYTSIPSDSLFRKMMVDSDNFLAEQLLILSSSTLSDTLSIKRIQSFILMNYLADIKQSPRWVDGSGLSRYNLFTPNSFVQVLTKMYNEVPHDRLMNMFPIGGESGTIKNWFSGNNRPYIYAKSGSLSNNYCLSGYLITNAGNTLVFSFMNNHYMKGSSEIKNEMQTILESLRDHF